MAEERRRIAAVRCAEEDSREHSTVDLFTVAHVAYGCPGLSCSLQQIFLHSIDCCSCHLRLSSTTC